MFKKIYIEITNVCNLSCDFCPKTQRNAEFISAELFEMILHKIHGYTKHVYFHVMGEPLLHPQIGHFLDLCDVYGYMVNLTTNGTLIRSVSDAILGKPALRQINFSVHSFDENTMGENSEISARKDEYKHEYIEAIYEFIQKVKQQKARMESKVKTPYVSMRLWNLDDNKTNRVILPKDLIGDQAIKFDSRNRMELSEGVFLNLSESFEWPDLDQVKRLQERHGRQEQMELKEQQESGFCYGLREQIAILVDGTVVPCCLDREGTVALGNIVDSSFEEIVEGSRARQMYDAFSKRKVVEPLCRACSFRKRFDM